MYFFEQLQNKNDSIDKSRLSIDSFKVLKYLNAGSYGKVFKVQMKHGQNKNKIYAMKVLCKAKYKNRIKISQAVRESTIMRSLQHPFIAELIYAFQNETKLYMVLEYASRGSLEDILENEYCLTEHEAAFYTKEIVLAIGYLHSLQIIHRDIKPENMLIDDNGHIKLTDFGLCAENISTKSRTYSYCGTMLYMAPELFRDNGYGKDVDWWALGVSFYRMVLGEYPFISCCEDHIIQTIKRGITSLPPDEISQEAESLIRGLLNTAPKERLGGFQGVQGVKNHSFFKYTCWDSVYDCLGTPPFMPETTDSRMSNPFRRLFQRRPVLSKTHPSDPNKINDDLFKGFSYPSTRCSNDVEVRQPASSLIRDDFTNSTLFRGNAFKNVLPVVKKNSAGNRNFKSM